MTEDATAGPIEGTIEPPFEVPDGWTVVTLKTEFGEAPIRVPPRNKWKSLEKNRISSGDDLGWAVLALKHEDAQAWMDLNPDGDESAAFFEELDRLAPAQSRHERRARRDR